MYEIKHKALHKFLDEVIEELECINKYRKSLNKKEYVVDELIKPLRYSLSQNVQLYAEFITDLEKCGTCAPVIMEYGNDDNCDTITIHLKMFKIYDELGDSYCPLKYRYELIFYRDEWAVMKNDNEEQYRFLLQKVYGIASGSVEDYD